MIESFSEKAEFISILCPYKEIGEGFLKDLCGAGGQSVGEKKITNQVYGFRLFSAEDFDNKLLENRVNASFSCILLVRRRTRQFSGCLGKQLIPLNTHCWLSFTFSASISMTTSHSGLSLANLARVVRLNIPLGLFSSLQKLYNQSPC